MNCTQLAEIFAGDCAEDLDEAASKAFDEHLNGCQTCLDLLAEAENELAPLTDWEPPQIPEADWNRVRDGIRAKLDTPAPIRLQPTRSRAPMFLALAAGLLFATGLGFLIVTPPNGGSSGTISQVNTETSHPETNDGAPDTAPTADAQVISLEAGEGYVTETIDVNGVPCVVIKEAS